MCVVCVCRHLLHVHDRRPLYVEAVPEETPGHQRQRLHRLRLPGCRHLLLCARSGAHELRLASFKMIIITIIMTSLFVLGLISRCLERETPCSGLFFQSSTSWPRSSSAHSCTTWADGDSVRAQLEAKRTLKSISKPRGVYR